MSGHESLGLRSCDSFGACNVEADAVCRETGMNATFLTALFGSEFAESSA